MNAHSLSTIIATAAAALLSAKPTSDRGASAEPKREQGISLVLLGEVAGSRPSLLLTDGSRLTVHFGSAVVNAHHNAAVFVEDADLSVLRGALGAVGGVRTKGSGAIRPRPQRRQEARDPLTRVIVPQGLVTRSERWLYVGGGRPVSLRPGRYLGGLCVAPGASLTLTPGVYCMENGDFTVLCSARVNGKEVTLVMTGERPGVLSACPGAAVEWSAPQRGPLQDLAIVSTRRRTGDSSELAFRGANLDVRGAVYAPKGRLSLFDATLAKVTRIVCSDLLLCGGSQLDVTGRSDRAPSPARSARSSGTR